MIYLERKITPKDFDDYHQIIVIFKFYDNKANLFETMTHKYRKQNGEFFLNIKTVNEKTFIKNIPIRDVKNMMSEINEWITHSYYCNEKGSVVMYTMAEEKSWIE